MQHLDNVMRLNFQIFLEGQNDLLKFIIFFGYFIKDNFVKLSEDIADSSTEAIKDFLAFDKKQGQVNCIIMPEIKFDRYFF